MSLLACALLPGCAVKPSLPDAGLVFKADGKFGIKDDEIGYSARFSWRHYRHGYDVEVWGPLGQGRTRLQGNVDTMRVSRGDELVAAGNPQQVMFEHLGWSLPIAVLPAWMRGFPAVELPHVDAVLDDKGRYLSFSQAGWRVVLERYLPREGLHETKQGARQTPGRIVATNGTRKVTVVVRNFAQ